MQILEQQFDTKAGWIGLYGYKGVGTQQQHLQSRRLNLEYL